MLIRGKMPYNIWYNSEMVDLEIGRCFIYDNILFWYGLGCRASVCGAVSNVHVCSRLAIMYLHCGRDFIPPDLIIILMNVCG